MQQAYVVIVKGNLVCAIQPRSASHEPAIAGTPLEIASALAANFESHGSIDGVYAFGDSAAARTFAVLCLGFSKALLERRLTIIENLPPGFSTYAADEQPASRQSD
jgi:hypothetical protein